MLSPRFRCFPTLLASAALLACAALALPAPAGAASTPAVALRLDQNGVQSLTYNGFDFAQPANSDFGLALKFPSYTIAEWDRQATQYGFQAPDTMVRSGAWGQATCQVVVQGAKVTFNVKVSNLSALPISQIHLFLMRMRFPGANLPQGWIQDDPPRADGLMVPALLTARFGVGNVFYLDNHIEPVQIRWAPYSWGGYRLEATANQTLQPGQSASFSFDLRFAPPAETSAAQAAPDFIVQYNALYPQTLSWPDRRPIASVFLASVNHKWANNPRGWFNNANLNVHTPQGLQQFQSTLAYYAANTARLCQEMNSQGAIVWDIEGEEFPMGVSTFVGDPRQVARLAPEMEPCADSFFKTLRDAGLRVGVCIRAQAVTYRADGSFYQLEYPDNASIYAGLEAKIAYAKARWGCTLFYVDSNGGRGGIYDVSIFRQLAQKHPDCLLIPEAQNDSYYGVTAPYDEMRWNGPAATGGGPLGIYPGAFSVLNVADADLKSRWAEEVAGVHRGDILLYRGWYESPEYQNVKAIYAQAYAGGGVAAFADAQAIKAGSRTDLNVLRLDWDRTAGATLRITGLTPPTVGGAYLADNRLYYVAPAQGGQTAKLSYTVSDGSSQQTVPVTVVVTP